MVQLKRQKFTFRNAVLKIVEFQVKNKKRATYDERNRKGSTLMRFCLNVLIEAQRCTEGSVNCHIANPGSWPAAEEHPSIGFQNSRENPQGSLRIEKPCWAKKWEPEGDPCKICRCKIIMVRNYTKSKMSNQWSPPIEPGSVWSCEMFAKQSTFLELLA